MGGEATPFAERQFRSKRTFRRDVVVVTMTIVTKFIALSAQSHTLGRSQNDLTSRPMMTHTSYTSLFCITEPVSLLGSVRKSLPESTSNFSSLEKKAPTRRILCITIMLGVDLVQCITCHVLRYVCEV